jgi:hypothetical protein
VELPLDRRPVVVALAGANGAGKSTFYRVHLRPAGLRFVNADVLARELKIGPYQAAGMAHALRRELVQQRVSFVFETVFSDPVGDKLAFLRDALRPGIPLFFALSESLVRKSPNNVSPCECRKVVTMCQGKSWQHHARASWRTLGPHCKK